ncbi:hypothetical protein [Haloechinothrix salitolerans]|uniref:Type IV secretory system conjugative DNA transfer family protein n=1 Tax=Haloechinothrix salitolerans TaxID=926830 RepID=A0ABW2C4R1_9PSEU
MRQPDPIIRRSTSGPNPRPDRTHGHEHGEPRRGPRRLRLTPAEHPARQHPKPLGVSNWDDSGDVIGMEVADARHHVHVQGVTGSGKSTWLANHVLAEAEAGRGVALLDCQGDLARNVLDRLPARCGDRLIILDPAETEAPPAWNVLAPVPGARTASAGREWAAENVVGVFRRLYAAWWGPRMDDVMRAASLTLARRPGSTLAEVITVLTQPGWRRDLLAEYGEPDGLDGFWDGFDQLSVGQRAQLCGPILSRLRGVLSRRFARDLLGAARSTINPTDVLDGGILIARLAKGEIGENTARLVGSLLLSGLWSHAIRRSALPPEQRRDATIVVDECHNFLHLPIGVDDTLAEARGYRISLVLAHQHLAQLPVEVRDAVNANARNKIVFTVSPDDASKLVRHVAPYFTEMDLSRRGAFEVVARIVHHGHDSPPFTLATEPLPPAVPGRAEALRAAARSRTGLPRGERDVTGMARKVDSKPGVTELRQSDRSTPQERGISPGTSPSNSPGISGGTVRAAGGDAAPDWGLSAGQHSEEESWREPDWLL